MANNLNFTYPGGFPLTQDTLKRMQKSYDEIGSALAAFFPNNGKFYVISGLEHTGDDPISGDPIHSDGWIVKLGQIYFVQGGIGYKILEEENVESLTFNDSNTHDVYFHTYYKIGSSGWDIRQWCKYGYLGSNTAKDVIDIGSISGCEVVKQGSLVTIKLPNFIFPSSGYVDSVPIDYRPTDTISGLLYFVSSSGNQYPVGWQIRPSGRLYIQKQANAPNVEFQSSTMIQYII